MISSSTNLQILSVLKKLSQSEYDRQLCAFSILDFGEAYQGAFFESLYEPFFKGLIDEELQIKELGCKVQLGENIVQTAMLS